MQLVFQRKFECNEPYSMAYNNTKPAAGTTPTVIHAQGLKAAADSSYCLHIVQRYIKQRPELTPMLLDHHHKFRYPCRGGNHQQVEHYTAVAFSLLACGASLTGSSGRLAVLKWSIRSHMS